MEEEVLLGICDGIEIPSAYAFQTEIMDTSHRIYGTFCEPGCVFGNDTLRNEGILCTRIIFWNIIECINISICPDRRNRYDKNGGYRFGKNIAATGNPAYFSGICVCVRHVSWLL